MGVKGTADATGNIFVLVLLFPIMIAKLMAYKYHKDGFFGMIKVTLAVLIAIGTIFVFMEVYESYGIMGGHKHRMESEKESIEYHTKRLEDGIRKDKIRKKQPLTQRDIRLINENKMYTVEMLKESVKQDIERANIEIEFNKKKFKERVIETIGLAFIAFVMFYISIKLFISSSNRSRALAKAEKEIIPNE